jgi:hypothetical protein
VHRCAALVPQAHIWGLDRQLDKFTTDYLQQRLQRGSHGLLTLAEMDFAFPPNVSPAMIVQARIKGHAAVSSAGMSPVNFGSRSAASKDSKLPGGISWLREVRVLQDPNPRLHNFPEVSLGPILFLTSQGLGFSIQGQMSNTLAVCWTLGVECQHGLCSLSLGAVAAM